MARRSRLTNKELFVVVIVVIFACALRRPFAHNVETFGDRVMLVREDLALSLLVMRNYPVRLIIRGKCSDCCALSV